MDIRKRKTTQVDLKLNAKKFKPDKELFVPGEAGASYSWEVRNIKTGVVSSHSDGWKKAESYLQQFIQLWMVQAAMAIDSTPFFATDPRATDGLYYPLTLSKSTFAANALVNDDDYGMLVGTGNTAPIITNYAMETKVDDGIGAGQLQYSLMSFGLPTSSATVAHFTCTRVFSNLSGGAVTIYEMGLAVKGEISSPFIQSASFALQNFLILRDVIVAGIAIPDGEALTLNYRQQVTS